MQIFKEGHLGGHVISSSTNPHGDVYTWYPCLWKWFVVHFGIKSVLDVGCGEAHSTSYFHNLGCEVLGIDGSFAAIKSSKIPEKVIRHDFCDGPFLPGRCYDMIWTCEFLEHVEERYKQHFLDTFKFGKKFLLMTHALPGQCGYYHVNCKDDEYWIKELDKIGFVFDSQLTKIARALAWRGYFWLSGLVFVTEEYAGTASFGKLKSAIIFRAYSSPIVLIKILRLAMRRNKLIYRLYKLCTLKYRFRREEES